MDEIIVRKAEVNYADELITLIDTVWRIAYKHIFSEEVFLEREKRQEVRIKNFSKDLKNKDVFKYVAEGEDKIMGVISGRLLCKYEHFAKLNYSDLEILYILPKYQGKGISTKMKNIFENWLTENQLSKYVIGVLKENEKAKMIYENWGGKLELYTYQFTVGEISTEEVFYTYIIK